MTVILIVDCLMIIVIVWLGFWQLNTAAVKVHHCIPVVYLHHFIVLVALWKASAVEIQGLFLSGIALCLFCLFLGC